jgi:PBP1b-binding outer membrane lipoprotein LpoB
MVRKLVSLLLVLVIGLFFVAGCKDEPEGLPDVQPEIKAAAEKAEEQAEVTEENLENEIDKLEKEIDSETAE